MLDGLILNAAECFHKKWIGNILDNQPQHMGASCSQAACSRMRGKVHRLNGFLHNCG